MPVQKAGLFLVAINDVNSFHHQFHDLRTRQQRARPPQQGDLPGIRPVIYEKFRNDPLTAGRKKFGQIPDHLEQTRFAADSRAGQSDSDQ